MPGAFVATCHSGVTLAAAHALGCWRRMIAAGALAADESPPSARGGSMFRRLPDAAGARGPVHRRRHGRARRATGDTVAAALLAAGIAPPAGTTPSPARRAGPTA